jgi:hypothetical protein
MKTLLHVHLVGLLRLGDPPKLGAESIGPGLGNPDLANQRL